MRYVGLASSEQARRGYWRVVLGGDVLDLGFFFSSPGKDWADRVESWRASVDEGKALVAASTSPASSTDGAQIYGARAVIDVHILGAELGETVGQVARRLNDLTASIDVLAVQAVGNSDAVARDALLRNEVSQAAKDPLGLGSIAKVISTTLKVAAVLAVLYVGAKIYATAKGK